MDKTIFSGLGEFLGVGALKVPLEKFYDEIFKNQFAEKLKSLGIVPKLALVLATGIVDFLVLGRISNETAFKRAVKEVGADFWPEIGRRLLNGHSTAIKQRLPPLTSKQSQQFDQLLRKQNKQLEELLTKLSSVKTKRTQPSVALTRAITGVRAARKNIQAKKRGILW